MGQEAADYHFLSDSAAEAWESRRKHSIKTNRGGAELHVFAESKSLRKEVKKVRATQLNAYARHVFSRKFCKKLEKYFSDK